MDTGHRFFAWKSRLTEPCLKSLNCRSLIHTRLQPGDPRAIELRNQRFLTSADHRNLCVFNNLDGQLATKPLKRFPQFPRASITGLKPGVNEKLFSETFEEIPFVCG
jgi:hypothetical protein